MPILKKGLVIAAGVAAIALGGSAASAVTPLGTLHIAAPDYADGFNFDLAGAFDFSYKVVVDTSGEFQLSGGIAGGKLSSVSFAGQTVDVTNSGHTFFSDLTPFNSGTYTAEFKGLSGPTGHVSGSFSLAPTAVPETATWAMMIAGVGIVGGALRRRNTRATVSFA